MNNLPFKLEKRLNFETKNSLEQLWLNGYVNIGRLFSEVEINTIKKIFEPLLQNPKSYDDIKKYENFYHKPAFGDKDAIFLSNIFGRNNKIEKIFENFFSNKLVKNILEFTLGPGYKIWEVGIRRAHNKDNGLSIHTDGKGEFGISILLNDHFSYEGTTVLFPKSHRFNIIPKDDGIEKYLRPSILKHFTKPLVGNAGDVFLFFKQTWHGRIKSDKAILSDSIIMGIYPVGYEFKPFNIEKKTFEKLPIELKRLIRTDESLYPTKDGFFKVTGRTTKNRLIDYLYNEKFYIKTLWSSFKLLVPFLNLINKVRKFLRLY